MFLIGYCTSKSGLAMAQHNSSSVFPYSQLEKAAASDTAQALHVCFFPGFMGGAEAWAGSMSSLIWCAHLPHP
jgi:hypothetical protein